MKIATIDNITITVSIPAFIFIKARINSKIDIIEVKTKERKVIPFKPNSDTPCPTPL